MRTTIRRSLTVAALTAFSQLAFAATVVKLDLGSTGPDVQFVDGVFSTVNDGDLSATSPGDQGSSVTFHEFVSGKPGVFNITPPAVGSFSLAGIATVGSPVFGLANTLQQQTTGGTFEIYSDTGQVLLTGSLEDGVLSGTSEAGGAAAGGFLTANLGRFTGPSDNSLNDLFSLLDPNSASISIPLSDVTGDSGSSGLSLVNNVLQGFTADAQVNIGADALSNQLPEPSSFGLTILASVGILGFRRRRS